MSTKRSSARVALITHPGEGAGAFARSLVERRLAACVNLVEVNSVFRWNGAITNEPEVLLVVKTRAERLEGIERALESEHPYDTPEFVVLIPDHVESKYLAWILAESEVRS